MTTALLGVSIPAFWIAILGVILFSVQLGWVPSSGFVADFAGRGAVVFLARSCRR